MDEKTYRKKVLGCWLGKAVGGTLGAPIEGWDGPHHLEFYDPVPTTMVPNDDLDLQVVWAMTIAAQPKPVVNSQILAEAWLKNVGFPWDEYAVAIRNLKNGIRPPFSGSYDNWFVDGMGCAIRSEIWACLAPGDPERAAKFAYEDAASTTTATACGRRFSSPRWNRPPSSKTTCARSSRSARNRFRPA